jgi:hypothetical protein
MLALAGPFFGMGIPEAVILLIVGVAAGSIAIVGISNVKKKRNSQYPPPSQQHQPPPPNPRDRR